MRLQGDRESGGDGVVQRGTGSAGIGHQRAARGSESVTRLQPGAPIMLSDEPAAAVCIAGFYIDYPDPNHPGQRLPGFITARRGPSEACTLQSS